MAKSPKVGTVIEFPIGEGSHCYLHYVGFGIYGDTVRVLDGLYSESLTAEQLTTLACEPEQLVEQTYVGSVLEVPGARAMIVTDTPTIEQMYRWWVVSPFPVKFEDRRVVSIDRREGFAMRDFITEYPDINPEMIPETGVVGEGQLRDMIRLGWKPGYGDFALWRDSNE